MAWKTLAPAVAAGLVSAAAFWWVAVRWICAECPDGAACTWNGACAGWLGGILGTVLVVLAVAIPYRLLEGRWPGRRR